MKKLIIYITILISQFVYCDTPKIEDFINDLDQNKISNIDYIKKISEFSSQIQITGDKDQNYKLIENVVFRLSPQKLVDSIGSALNNLAPLFRQNVILDAHHDFVKYSMIALAMINDKSSINYIIKYLYDADWEIQFNAYKSLAIFSSNEQELTGTFDFSKLEHWFPPIQSTIDFAINYLKEKNKSTSWDIYAFNKAMNETFWDKLNSCNFDNREAVDEIITDLKNNNKNIEQQVNNIIEEMSLSKKFIKRLQENLSNHHFFLQYRSRLLGLSKNNIIVDINTKTFKPIFVFNLSSKTYVILRGDHQIENDKISELIYSNNEYRLEPRFTLIYKVENIMNSGKEDIRISGQNWFLNINKKSAIIKNGIVCGDKVNLELGI